jgi:Fur family ferric uptake transcriptional regulator
MALPAILLSERLPLAEKLQLALQYCQAKGLRHTQPLRTILEVLIKGERPICWTDLSEDPQLRAACNPSSVFRILIRLEESGVVHRLAAARRSYYFALNIEGRAYDQIVCTSCGCDEIFSRDHPLADFTDDIRTRTRYRGIYHQLTFYGVCPRCQKETQPTSK